MSDVAIDSLPELDVEDAKRVLAAAIGRELQALAGRINEDVAALDALRRAAGFVNGLSAATNSSKRQLEEAARVLTQEIDDVRRALSQKPAMTEAVDAEQAEAVRTQRIKG